MTRIKIVNATKSVEEVHKEIVKIVEEQLFEKVKV